MHRLACKGAVNPLTSVLEAEADRRVRTASSATDGQRN
jgi:hypothetical protein